MTRNWTYPIVIYIRFPWLVTYISIVIYMYGWAISIMLPLGPKAFGSFGQAMPCGRTSRSLCLWPERPSLCQVGFVCQGEKNKVRCRLVGLREKLLDTRIFHGKIFGFRFRFSLKSTLWRWALKYLIWTFYRYLLFFWWVWLLKALNVMILVTA